MSLRIAKILHDSIVDGPGLRAVVFVQGCPPPHCEGCHNPGSHDMEGGREMTAEEVLAEMTRNPLCSGVTFSGGEPMAQAEELLPLARELRTRNYNLWLYTKYVWEHFTERQRSLAELCDVVVDGPFILAQRSLSLPWRGSGNQRVIDVQKSLAGGGVVEFY